MKQYPKISCVIFLSVLMVTILPSCTTLDEASQQSTSTTLSEDVIANAAPTEAPTVIPTDTPAPTAIPTEVPTPEPTIAPTATPEPTIPPTQEPTATPTTVLTPEPTIAPTPIPTPTTTPVSDVMVWIPQSGSKYHSKSSCSNMEDPKQVTKTEAINMGFEPCKRCH